MAVNTLAAIAMQSVRAVSAYKERARTTLPHTPSDQSKGVEVDKPRGKLKDVGALWKGKPGSKLLLTGEIELPSGGKMRLLMFANQHKKSDKHPDYKLCTEVPFEDETQAPDSVSDDDVAF
jgi:hypothetical protein